MAAINHSITMEQGTYNEEEVAKLHSLMNARALRKKRIRKAVLVSVNIIFALFMLFPLLYSVSVSIMPSDELFTMEMNLIPSHPTFDNYVRAFTQVPLVRFILNSFLVDRSLPVPWQHSHSHFSISRERMCCLCW